jgi:cobalt-zinc-cadmium efflux system protein
MAHEHHHSSSSKNIRTAFFLNVGFTLFEIIGGIYVNSVAIISDAIHDLGDSISLGMSWYLQDKSNKPATKEFTFGYRRFSLLGALINGIILFGGSLFIIVEAIKRIISPEHSNATGMLIFAIIGIAVNGYAAYKMSTGKSLNEKTVSLHLLEDMMGWIAIFIVSIILQFKDIQILDPILSLAITSYILYNGTKRLMETMSIFLQAQPKDIDREKIEEELLAVECVESMHHLHIWSLDGEHHVLTAHLQMTQDVTIKDMLKAKKAFRNILKKYPFEHFTVQTELKGEEATP